MAQVTLIGSPDDPALGAALEPALGPGHRGGKRVADPWVAEVGHPRPVDAAFDQPCGHMAGEGWPARIQDVDRAFAVGAGGGPDGEREPRRGPVREQDDAPEPPPQARGRRRSLVFQLRRPTLPTTSLTPSPRWSALRRPNRRTTALSSLPGSRLLVLWTSMSGGSAARRPASRTGCSGFPGATMTGYQPQRGRYSECLSVRTTPMPPTGGK